MSLGSKICPHFLTLASDLIEIPKIEPMFIIIWFELFKKGPTPIPFGSIRVSIETSDKTLVIVP